MKELHIVRTNQGFSFILLTDNKEFPDFISRDLSENFFDASIPQSIISNQWKEL
jgi:hypothetical protein